MSKRGNSKNMKAGTLWLKKWKQGNMKRWRMKKALSSSRAAIDAQTVARQERQKTEEQLATIAAIIRRENISLDGLL